MAKPKLALTLVGEEASSANGGVDIIAVHGLQKSFWSLNLLAADLAPAGIFAYEYHLSFSPNGYGIIEAGDNLLDELKKRREDKAEEPKPIIFIGHSLGGLVIKRALVGAFHDRGDEFLNEVVARTRGIIFLGTPHSTSSSELYTTVGRITNSSEPTTVSMVAIQSLQQIINQFMALPWDGLTWRITSFYEVLPLPGGTVRAVERSQTELWTFPQVSLNRHHHDMCRFTSDDDPSYIKVLESLRNIIIGYNSTNQVTVHPTLASAEQEVLQSLPFEDASTHVPDADRDTCNWFLEHDTYKSWREEPTRILWLQGKAGSGKSVLSKYVINHLSESAANSAQVLYFFFSHCGPNQSMTKLLSSVLHQQLLQSTSSFTTSEILTKLAEKREIKGSDTPWDDDLLIECFLRLVDKSTALGQSLYFVIDALDECDDLDKVVSLLQRLNTGFNPPRSIRTYISSRHSSPFRPVWEIRIEDNNFFGIQKYLNDKIKKWQGPLFSSLDVQECTQAIAEGAQGVFLWAALVVSDLLRSSYLKSDKSAQTLTWSLPTDLRAAYETTLERLWHSHTMRRRRLAQDALILVMCAQRPLSIPELRNALAVTDGGLSHRQTNWTQGPGDGDARLDNTSTDLATQLLILCGGLLEVSPQISRSANGNMTTLGSSVLFIHETVREFLMGNGSCVLETPRGKGCKADFQLRVAEICFSSINEITETLAFPQFSIINREAYPSQFLQYAVSYGMQHLNLASRMGVWPKEEDTWRSPIFQEEFVERWIHVHKRFFGSWGHFRPGKTKAAHLMSYFGLPWLDTGIWGGSLGDINEKDHHGQTPLSLAAAMGHLDLCKALIDFGADVNNRDYVYGQTPLSLAAAHGHQKTVELLLHAGSDHRNYTSGTPTLAMAIRSANLDIVRLLLESGAEINIANVQTGETALSQAAALGHVPIVSLLLESGAEVDSWDKRGWTPLHHAISQSQKKTVEVLIEALRPAQLYRLRTGFVKTKNSWVETVFRAIILYLYLNQCGNSQTCPSRNSQEPQTPGSLSFNRTSTTSHRKRGRYKRGSDSEDDFEEEDRGIPKKRPRRLDPGAKRFACPYHKKNAEKYPSGACNGKGFETIHRLKQHLKVHSRVKEWQRCHICKARFRHDEIARHPDCVRRDEPSDYEEGYDAVQLQKLESKDLFPSKSSDEKCWYGIFKVLFPDWPQTEKIPSPYHDNQIQAISSHYQQVVRDFGDMMTSPDTIGEIITNAHGQSEQGVLRVLERLFEYLSNRLGVPSTNESGELHRGSGMTSRIVPRQLITTQSNPGATAMAPSIFGEHSHGEGNSQVMGRLMGDNTGTQECLPYPEQLPFRTSHGHHYESAFGPHSSAMSSSGLNPSLLISPYSLLSSIPTNDTVFSDDSSRAQENMNNGDNLLSYSQQATGAISQSETYPQLSSDTGYNLETIFPMNNQDTGSGYVESSVPSSHATQMGLREIDSTGPPEHSPGGGTA
ncbi:hypothetical protein ANO14919_111990 [Xylariales sp. No.14919]|nr:hypothetical protein ANO14919_111990 [Xylariales sp. No.14919]